MGRRRKRGCRNHGEKQYLRRYKEEKAKGEDKRNREEKECEKDEGSRVKEQSSEMRGRILKVRICLVR